MDLPLAACCKRLHVVILVLHRSLSGAADMFQTTWLYVEIVELNFGYNCQHELLEAAHVKPKEAIESNNRPQCFLRNRLQA
jgi:hypothetical protein